MDSFVKKGEQVFKEKLDEIDEYASSLPTDEEILKKVEEAHSGANDVIENCSKFQKELEKCKSALASIKFSGKKKIEAEIESENIAAENKLLPLRGILDEIKVYQKSTFVEKVKMVFEYKEGLGFKKNHYRKALRALKACELELDKRIKEKDNILANSSASKNEDILYEKNSRLSSLENEAKKKAREAIRTIQNMKEI